jgi:predicted phosphodiesterase
MRIAVLADVHGNAVALDAVLAETEGIGVDGYWLLGDYASGPLPARALATLRELPRPVVAVRGNADREVVETAAGARPPLPEDADDDTRLWRERDDWVTAQLDAADLRWLAGHPLTERTTRPGGSAVVLAHATPGGDERLLTPATPDDAVREALAGVDASLVLCGHIHVQYARAVDGVELVNVGSVGLAYEGDPAAFWGLLTDDGVELRRTPYDARRAAAECRAAGFPGADDYAESMLLDPPSRADAVAVFEQRRLAGATRCC